MLEYNTAQREKLPVSLSGGTENNGVTEQREEMFDHFFFKVQKSLTDTNYNAMLSKLIYQHLNYSSLPPVS